MLDSRALAFDSTEALPGAFLAVTAITVALTAVLVIAVEEPLGARNAGIVGDSAAPHRVVIVARILLFVGAGGFICAILTVARALAFASVCAIAIAIRSSFVARAITRVAARK